MKMDNVGALTGLTSPQTLREYANQSVRRVDTGNSAAFDDTVEISELALFLNRLSELPEHRARRIVEVRSAILAQRYETPEKLDVAVDRMLEHLKAPAE